MNQLAALLSFLAAPAEQQIAALPSLPNDPGARQYDADFRHNPLLILVEAYNRCLHHRDDESSEQFDQRLGMSRSAAPWPVSMAELDYVLNTVKPEDRTLWVKKGLERKVEWRLVRRLARAALDDFGWAAHVDSAALAAIQEKYSSTIQNEWREEGRQWAVGHRPEADH